MKQDSLNCSCFQWVLLAEDLCVILSRAGPSPRSILDSLRHEQPIKLSVMRGSISTVASLILTSSIPFSVLKPLENFETLLERTYFVRD